MKLKGISLVEKGAKNPVVRFERVKSAYVRSRRLTNSFEGKLARVQSRQRSGNNRSWTFLEG